MRWGWVQTGTVLEYWFKWGGQKPSYFSNWFSLAVYFLSRKHYLNVYLFCCLWVIENSCRKELRKMHSCPGADSIRFLKSKFFVCSTQLTSQEFAKGQFSVLTNQPSENWSSWNHNFLTSTLSLSLLPSLFFHYIFTSFFPFFFSSINIYLVPTLS